MSPTSGQQALRAYELMQKHPELTQGAAAEAVGGTTRNAVSRVTQMHINGAVPELVEAVREDLITVSTAADLARRTGREQRMAVSLRRREPVQQVSVSSLTPAQLRRAMARFVGFDAVRAEFTTELLLRVPADELDSFADRLRASRTATENLLRDIKKITEQRTQS
jgi:hypothetical protein